MEKLYLKFLQYEVRRSQIIIEIKGGIEELKGADRCEIFGDFIRFCVYLFIG